MKPEKEPPEAFSEVVRRVADGECEINCSRELQRLLMSLRGQASAQVREVNGSLTLKLSIACDPHGMLAIAYALERKDPKKQTSRSVCWVTKGGNLSFDMPRQEKLPLIEPARPQRREVVYDAADDETDSN